MARNPRIKKDFRKGCANANGKAKRWGQKHKGGRFFAAIFARLLIFGFVREGVQEVAESVLPEREKQRSWTFASLQTIHFLKNCTRTHAAAILLALGGTNVSATIMMEIGPLDRRPPILPARQFTARAELPPQPRENLTCTFPGPLFQCDLQ
jgi:hypothetical protein